ncbi:hypothetical protein [Microbacterium foliorum]|uniref:hypothetical protein n=1 Tax=Microbacterium foliorum TaxID=104336 RepID=UPI0012946FFE|nr:hypothetical protein [Microbacterium foliorum]
MSTTDGIIQNLGIKIANDAITIASLETQLGEARAEKARLQAAAPEESSAPEGDED